MKQRQIKFRAWFSKLKQMRVLDQITFTKKEWHISSGWGICVKTQPHIPIMQFTGMFDKNGKEIYEGDLLQLYKNKKGLFEVIFKNAYVGGWVLRQNGIYDVISLGVRESNEIEVRGNIYENSELLKLKN